MTTRNFERLGLRGGDTSTRCSGSVHSGETKWRGDPQGNRRGETYHRGQRFGDLVKYDTPRWKSALGQVHGGLFETTHNDGRTSIEKETIPGVRELGGTVGRSSLRQDGYGTKIGSLRVKPGCLHIYYSKRTKFGNSNITKQCRYYSVDTMTFLKFGLSVKI